MAFKNWHSSCILFFQSSCWEANMSDFFKQFLNQVRDIWVRFSALQKVILISAFVLTFAGIIISIGISSIDAEKRGQVTLYANLGIEDAAEITAFLKEVSIPYQLENDGRTVTVPKMMVHQARMELARGGLPRKSGKGYELFDETQLGVTDFVQNLNYKRAVETELRRSIETLREVDVARVHLTFPKETIFMESKEEATASVIIKIRPGDELNKRQIRGITHLVASGAEGLKARQVTILDESGNMLTKGFADNAMAEATDHNMELQRGVERHLESKVMTILGGVLGPNKSRVKVSAEIDFSQVNKTIESYDPKKKVVRSEQRDDGTRKNSPAVGDETKEGSITNYEIDRTVANVLESPGSRKRITVSVAVDGTYSQDEEGKRNFVPRSEDEIAILSRLVKTAVGYTEARSDEVFVASIQFDNSFLEKELSEIKSMETQEMIEQAMKYGMIILIVLMGVFFMRRVISDVVTAMNPPLPRYAGIDLDIEEESIPENVKRQNDIIDRMEGAARDNPGNVAELIRSWLSEEQTVAKK